MWKYSRQIVLPAIGYEGQAKIKESSIMLAGVGGLGTPIAYQLVAMGIGHIKIVDRDVVSLSDLHRQYLYTIDDIGLPKVEVASKRLSKLNPEVEIEPIPTSIRSWNIENLCKDVTVVVDGLDSIETRYLLNRTCLKLNTPYVYGGALQTHGNVTTIIPQRTPCLECLQPQLRDEDLPKCGVVGVYTPLLSMIASIEVSETIRLLTNQKPRLAGKLFCVDAFDLSFEEFDITRNENCSMCGDLIKQQATPTHPLDKEKSVEEECSRDGKKTFVISPQELLEVDLHEAGSKLNILGYEGIKKGNLGITFKNKEDSTVSLLKSGVAIFKFPSIKENEQIDDIKTLYGKLIGRSLEKRFN